MKSTVAIILMTGLALQAQDYTRGLGVYPGSPKEEFVPRMRVDATSYRNLALHRPAYHSSSYDYNLTAQLVTDGIKDTRLPRWEAVSSSKQGALKKNERQWMFDQNPVTNLEIKGKTAWVQVDLAGGDAALAVDRIDLEARAQSFGSQSKSWTCVISGSDDGSAWKELGRTANPPKPKEPMTPSVASVAFATASNSRFYRFEFESASETTWIVGDFSFFNHGKRVGIGGPHDFTSAWMSEGKGEEWVYVDLGAVCKFDRITLAWIRRAAEGSLQTSNDAENWTTVQALPASQGASDDIKLAKPAQGRYVRVLMTRPSSPEGVGSSRVDLQACKLEYSIVSPK